MSRRYGDHEEDISQDYVYGEDHSQSEDEEDHDDEEQSITADESESETSVDFATQKQLKQRAYKDYKNAHGRTEYNSARKRGGKIWEDEKISTQNNNHKHNKRNISTESESSNLSIFLATFCIICILVGGFVYFSEKNYTVSSSYNLWPIFNENFDRLIRPKYDRYVPPNGFHVLFSALKDVLTRNHTLTKKYREPAIVMFIGTKENSNIIDCIVRELMEQVAKVYKEDVTDPLQGDLISNARKISDYFDHTFTTLKRHSIFVKSLEVINGRAAKAFHSYTDGPDSSYPDVVIFTSAYDDSVSKLTADVSAKRMDQIANDILTRAWITSESEDTIASLLSRLTPSVVSIINGDPKFSC